MTELLPKFEISRNGIKFNFDKPPTYVDRLKSRVIFAVMDLKALITGTGIKVKNK